MTEHAGTLAVLLAVAVEPVDLEILALEDRLRCAQLQADVAELDALIAEDLLFVGPDGVLLSKADDLASHASGHVRFRAHEPEWIRVRRLSADVAVVLLRARLSVDVAGQSFGGTYQYTRVWARRDAGLGWRVSAGQVGAV